VQSLRQQLADPHSPAGLRIELGRLLQYHQELEPHLLEQMLDTSNPAPLRLDRGGDVLADHIEEGPTRATAGDDAARLARLPNREIALATADVINGVWRRSGSGLANRCRRSTPARRPRWTRRVMLWAAQYDQGEEIWRIAHDPARVALARRAHHKGTKTQKK